MPEQEFLASFGVEIDESGVERLQEALSRNRELAEELASGAGLSGALSGISQVLSAPSPAPNVSNSSSRTVQAPVSINVSAAGSSPESVARSVYDVTEQYLLRTLNSYG